jgi:DHA1 family bicyclomycin/chloramphenicol resistance-like MFS transporter
VTALAESPRTGRRHVALGSPAFIAILAATMATTALGIDTVLPAYDELRTAFDLEADASEVTGVITFFFMGSSLGLLPAGLMSDRFGRRAVMWGGLTIYIIGAIGSILAPSLTMLFISRFVWGLGSAGPRVAAMARVRDGFVGEQMAKQMSTLMAIFLVVPAVAPALGAGLLAIGSWEWVFAVCAVVAVIVMMLVTRLPETLPVEARRPLVVRSVWATGRVVLTTPGTGWFLLSLTALFTSFLSFLSGSELIVDQTYDLADWFPLFFAIAAVVMLGSMLLNGRMVENVGLDRLIGILFKTGTVTTSITFTIAFATGGEPPFWMFVALICLVLFSQQMLLPNLNSSAMRPLGEVAGTGVAMLGMVSGVIAGVLSEVVNSQFDGTMRPLAVVFVVATFVAFSAWRRAVAATPDPSTWTVPAAAAQPAASD